MPDYISRTKLSTRIFCVLVALVTSYASFYLILNLAWAIGFDFDQFPIMPIKPIDPIMKAIYYGERANFGLYFWIVDCPIFITCLASWWIGVFHAFDLPVETPEETESRLRGEMMCEQGQAALWAKGEPHTFIDRDYREESRRISERQAEIIGQEWNVHREKRDPELRRAIRDVCGDCKELERKYGSYRLKTCPKCGHYYHGKNCNCRENDYIMKILGIYRDHSLSKACLTIGAIVLSVDIFWLWITSHIYTNAITHQTKLYSPHLGIGTVVGIASVALLILGMIFRRKYTSKMRKSILPKPNGEIRPVEGCIGD